MDNVLENALSFLPGTLRSELLSEYRKILNCYYEGKWELAELGGGKFCEIVYSILHGHATGRYPDNAALPPRNMEGSLVAFANNTAVVDSLRLTVPRALIFLYDIRNKRGVGHIGGNQIIPNQMDSIVVLGIVNWVMSELIRVLHRTSSNAAMTAIEKLSSKNIPLIWEHNGVKRVLEKMDKKSQTILVLYSFDNALSVEKLMESVEYSNKSVFRKTIIQPYHQKRIVEYDRAGDVVLLTPKGIMLAEELIEKYKMRQLKTPHNLQGEITN